MMPLRVVPFSTASTYRSAHASSVNVTERVLWMRSPDRVFLVHVSPVMMGSSSDRISTYTQMR